MSKRIGCAQSLATVDVIFKVIAYTEWKIQWRSLITNAFSLLTNFHSLDTKWLILEFKSKTEI